MSLTKNLSVILITKNEEKNIKRCLDSLTWVNEIVIADSHSTDQTIQIINSYSNTKIIDTDWLGFSDTKTLAIKHTTNDWILWIDADEEITQELRSEIESLSASSTNSNATSAYKINRANFFMDKRVRFSGWQNDWVTRLFKKSEVKFDGKAVHEKLIVTGAVKKLSSKMNHYTYQGLNHYMLKFEEYTLLGAQKRMDKIKRVY
ncbi:MAG: glycosyltransferase involved in cell wall biosynthesis, partial [Thermoproteota archaeon]